MIVVFNPDDPRRAFLFGMRGHLSGLENRDKPASDLFVSKGVKFTHSLEILLKDFRVDGRKKPLFF